MLVIVYKVIRVVSVGQRDVTYPEGAFCEEGNRTPYTFESVTFDYFSERIY